MSKAKSCSKCQNELERGFIPDYTYGGAFHSRWIKGEPHRATLLGFKTPGIKPPKFSEGEEITAYKCKSCGIVEFYAE